MASVECITCAWRATCSLKYRYESSEIHCREFTKDVTIQQPESGNQKDNTDDGDGMEKEINKAE
ncbi:MAG: hypothetical protein OEZ28_14380 [Nitrospinota bacterium]|nr:hypothetical protein [Nitrospinota bacterium]